MTAVYPSLGMFQAERPSGAETLTINCGPPSLPPAGSRADRSGGALPATAIGAMAVAAFVALAAWAARRWAPGP
jgi:hypothetical protein